MTAALAALALLAAAAEPQSLAIDAARSSVRYFVKHKLHPADGRSSAIEGKAVIQPDGKVMAMFRVPVTSFDSGDSNRDANMRETLEAAKHPFVVFKGVTALGMPPPQGKAVAATIQGELDFHGVKRALEVPVTIQFAADGSASVKGTMHVSLEAHQIERPSLLLIKLENDCRVEIDLQLRKAP